MPKSHHTRKGKTRKHTNGTAGSRVNGNGIGLKKFRIPKPSNRKAT